MFRSRAAVSAVSTTAGAEGFEATGVEASDGGSVVVARVVEAEAELSGGFKGPAPGRRPILGFGLKDNPPVFFNIELMVAVLDRCPRSRLYWNQMRGWHGLSTAWRGDMDSRGCDKQGSTSYRCNENGWKNESMKRACMQI